MKSKVIVILFATAALAGCSQSGEEMNEPSGAERPTYQTPGRSTNAPAHSTNDAGASSGNTNNVNSPGAGTSATP
jgi:hypothetical protein